MKKEKKFFIPANNIKDLLTDWNEAGGCFASDRITVDGLPVGYMYREIPDGESPFGEYDSGWRFFAGDEDDEYANNPENLDIYSLNTICNYSQILYRFFTLHTVPHTAEMKMECFKKNLWNL